MDRIWILLISMYLQSVSMEFYYSSDWFALASIDFYQFPSSRVCFDAFWMISESLVSFPESAWACYERILNLAWMFWIRRNSMEFKRNLLNNRSTKHMQLDAFKTSVEPVSTGCCKFGMGFVILWIILEFQYSLEFCGLQFRTIGSQTISELFFTVLQPYYSHPRVWSVRMFSISADFLVIVPIPSLLQRPQRRRRDRCRSAHRSPPNSKCRYKKHSSHWVC